MENAKKLFYILIIVLILIISPNIVFANKNNLEDVLNQNINSSYDMIIIAPDSYKSALEKLIEHKNNRGLITNFVSVDKIYEGTYFEIKGRDNQEKIKYFIKDAIENWGVYYILFVGTSSQIPVRYCYNFDNYSNYPEYSFISELYYADIYTLTGSFSDWDYDGDGIFGEWTGDVAEDKFIDLKPDVCLGRLPCVNNQEVETIVKKIIEYENQPSDPSWFNKMAVAGGDTYSQFEGYEGEIYNQMALDSMNGFTPVKLWASTGDLSKYGQSIINAVDNGCGFLYLSGHGSRKIWVTNSPTKSSVGKFGKFQMFFLNNKDKLPICIVEGCHNSEFAIKPNVNQKNILSQWSLQTSLKGCWSWLLTIKKTGGAIATIGDTGLCWYGSEYAGGGANYLNLQFFKTYANGEKILGKIWKNAIDLYLDSYPINWETPAGDVSSLDAKTVQEWTILGDPSLQIGGGI